MSYYYMIPMHARILSSHGHIDDPNLKHLHAPHYSLHTKHKL